MIRSGWLLCCCVIVACGAPTEVPDGGSAGGAAGGSAGGAAGGSAGGAAGGTAGTAPVIAGCQILPADNIFNTRIDGLPPHPSSAAYMANIGSVNIHLDLGTSENQSSPDYYGIPYNTVNGGTVTWLNVSYSTTHPNYTWNPRDEADCAIGTAHTVVSPCTAAAAPMPQLPIPPNPKVEGGIYADTTTTPDGDHHILILDTASCRLWETYHSYTGTTTPWNIFGSATWALNSNALRPDGWTSAEAAGFPILPLLLRADEASTGSIKHALRMTLPNAKIRGSHVWPARHHTGSVTAANAPQMGQLFRLKASYQIPANYSVQSKAILTALKQYGAYIADNGSAFYIQGEPKTGWSQTVFSEVQSVNSSNFEAVDISAITGRTGFNPNSGAVPP